MPFQFSNQVLMWNCWLVTPLGSSREIFHVFNQLSKLINRQNYCSLLSRVIRHVLQFQLLHIQHFDLLPGTVIIL